LSVSSSQRVFTAIIIGYKRGSARQYNNKVLVKPLVDPKLAPLLIGSKIEVVDSYGNKYSGRLVRVHSKKHGVLVAVFRPNIPGQLIGARAKILKK